MDPNLKSMTYPGGPIRPEGMVSLVEQTFAAERDKLRDAIRRQADAIRRQADEFGRLKSAATRACEVLMNLRTQKEAWSALDPVFQERVRDAIHRLSLWGAHP